MAKSSAIGAAMGSQAGFLGMLVGAAAGAAASHADTIKRALDRANQESDCDITTIKIECQPETPSSDCESDNPPELSKFEEPVNGFSADELNSATLTIFGEISASLNCQRIEDEAHATASTIFNRRNAIIDARSACNTAQAAIAPLQRKFDELREQSTRVSQADWPEFKKEYYAVQAQLSQAQRAGNIACGNEKVAAESFLSPADRDKEPTLSRIVTAKAPDGNDQYEGYAKGSQDFDNYSTMSLPDKQRNCRRWAIAKTAINDLASGQPADPYMEFRSNRNGARTLNSGETRICGTDFSEGNM